MYKHIELWGLKIGYKVSNYKYRGSFSNLSYQIEDMVKLATQQNYDCRHWEFIYSALQTYKHIYGHIDIPLDYEVPEGPAWGSELWGLKLGCRVRNIRYSKLCTFTCIYIPIHSYTLCYTYMYLFVSYTTLVCVCMGHDFDLRRRFCQRGPGSPGPIERTGLQVAPVKALLLHLLDHYLDSR